MFAPGHPVSSVIDPGKAEKVIAQVVASVENPPVAHGRLWSFADPQFHRWQHHH